MHRWAIFLTVVAVSTGPLFADEAEDSYKMLFGDRFEQAVASAGTADDLALATEMVDTARKLASLPKVAALLCDKAYQLTSNHPDGLDTAASAMVLLAEQMPSRAAEATERLIDVRQRILIRAEPDNRVAAGQALVEVLNRAADEHIDKGEAGAAVALYRRALSVGVQIKSDAAPEIKVKLAAAVSAERIERRVDMLGTTVLENATDHESVAQLVRLLVIDMDKPALAQQYANRLKDEDLKKHMILAAKPVDELAEDEAQSLGVWYRTQGMEAKEVRVKGAMLAHAAQCFERYLTLHKAEDPQRNIVTLTLESVRRDIAELEESVDSKSAKGFKGSDLTAEFPSGESPDGKVNAGPWTFGWAPANKLGEFTPYEEVRLVPGVSISLVGKASVWRNIGKAAAYGVAPGEVSFHGGPNQEMSIARWTSPTTGKVHVAGAFGAGDGGTVDVYIVKVSRSEVTELFRKAATGIAEPFDLSVAVRAGEKLDFIVGTAGSHGSDNTPLSVRIMPAKAGTGTGPLRKTP